MSHAIQRIGLLLIIVALVAPVRAQAQPDARNTAPAVRLAPPDAPTPAVNSAISLKTAVSREAARMAAETAAQAQQPAQRKQSWAARHKWATVAIVAGVGLLAYGVMYAALDD